MRNIYYVISIIILFSFQVSCTRDYFEDETNIRIYIPEIEDKSINNLQLYIYDDDGRLVRQKECIYPFDDEMFINAGILRFSVPPGIYTLSCFANSKVDSSLVNIHAEKDVSNSYVGLEKLSDNIYKTPPPLRKVLNRTIEAKLIGESNKLDTVNIDEDKVHVGKIKYVFKGLPQSIGRVDVYTEGLSTALSFLDENEGDVHEYVFTSAIRPDLQNTFSFEDYYFPSILNEEGEVTMSLLVVFFDHNGNKVATYSDDLPQVSDADGNLVPPVLHSRQTLTISFDGFVFGDISIDDWGDITDGDITPM